MKLRTIKSLIRAKQKIERGETAPARVWKILPDGKGGFIRSKISPRKFQQHQKVDWQNRVVEIRRKLELSQMEFAHLLGISVRTLHQWEQGRRVPSGAAGVLIRIAAGHPKIVLKAAA
ncbi:MAG: helix-turn-helix domain-containing protein [Verrucomicrobiota bacterium]